MSVPLKRLFALALLMMGLTSGSATWAQASSSNIKLPPPTQEVSKDENRSFKGDLTFVVLGRRYDDPYANSRWARLVLEMNLEGRYEEWLRGKVSLLQLLSAGSASYQLGVTEQSPANILLITEASVTLAPTNWVEASAGILKVNLGSVASLLYEENQAGAQLELKRESEIAKISLKGSQSIPTTKSSSNVIADEGTSPLMTVGVLQGELKFDSVGTTLKSSVSHYEYTDLPSGVAGEALRTGSTVSGTKDFQFAYEFRGKEFALAWDQLLGSQNKVSTSASIMKNELAPESLNAAKQWRFQYTRMFSKFEIGLGYSQFRLESDAIPSPYGVPILGYANRVGAGYGLRFGFPKQKFNLFAGYTTTNPINNAIPGGVQTNAATYQADREIYNVGAEAKYDMF